MKNEELRMKNYLICLFALVFVSCQSESDGQAVDAFLMKNEE